LDHLGGGVQKPSEDHIASGPGRITFQQFLDESRFMEKWAICTAEDAEYPIQSMQQCLFHTPPSGCTSLYHYNKVINVNMDNRPMDVNMLPLMGFLVRLKLGLTDCYATFHLRHLLDAMCLLDHTLRNGYIG
jgi:hypothetical protein